MPTLLDTASAWLDRRVVGNQAFRVGRSAEVEAMDRLLRLARLIDFAPMYDRDDLLPFPGGFLVEGPAISPTITRSYRPGIGRVADLAWPSGYVPWNPEVADGYVAQVANATAAARAITSEKPGKTIVVIHGYGAGHLGFEPHVWPLRAWRRAGWDVVFAVLPFHGTRAPNGRRMAPPFPAADPRVTNEGFRQAVHDLTALIRWLRANGHGPIGLMGMSLGGYTSALLATTVPDLAFAGLVIPLGSLADYARTHGRLGDGPTAHAMHAALDRVYRPTIPLSRPPRLPPERVRIVAARADQITGLAHAERLGRHFGVEPIVCPGGHVLQMGLRSGWKALGAWLAAM